MFKKILVWGGIALAVFVLFGIAGSWYGLGQMIGSMITGIIAAAQGFAEGIGGG